MDALLHYAIYQIAFTLLRYEIYLMLFCCLAIILVKLYTRWSAKRRIKNQNEIGNVIEAYHFSNEALDTIKIPKNSNFRNIVETLEKYDQMLNDPRWIAIKEKLVSTYLLPQIDFFANSYKWFNRQLAARALLLCPNFASEKILAKLLDDRRYLVRVAAAVCITQTSYKDLFHKVIRKMSHETALSQFPYRDALIQGNDEKYRWIEALLAIETDKNVIANCLDILSTRYSGNLQNLVIPFVNDSDPVCRVLAIKALANIPSPESVELLIDRLTDSDWKIRAEAIQSLQKLYAAQTIPNLKKLLNDPVWWVRLQAALTLKSFGKDGIEALTAQTQKNEPSSYEIAQYVLALPE
jgi:hypothetical protein